MAADDRCRSGCDEEASTADSSSGGTAITADSSGGGKAIPADSSGGGTAITAGSSGDGFGLAAACRSPVSQGEHPDQIEFIIQLYA